MFILIILVLLAVSFLLSLLSLRIELKKNIKTEQVTDELAKGRVIFHAPSPNEPEQQTPEVPNPVPTIVHPFHHAESSENHTNPEADLHIDEIT
jgi:hypothetical protein